MSIWVIILRAIVISFQTIFCKIKRILVHGHTTIYSIFPFITGHFSYNSIFAGKTALQQSFLSMNFSLHF